MSRELVSYKVNGVNDMLKVEVIDEPGSGGANHSYYVYPTAGNASGVRIDFQKGPLSETSYPNGLTQEVLLSIVEERLKGFQSGQCACRENAVALTKVQEAMMWLKRRTEERVARGVEGTHQK
jgi:hypothetical protein